MIFVGFNFAPVPNWESIMPINAPANYKKPEAIEKYKAERRAVLAGGEAAVNQLTGLVTNIAIRDGENGEIEVISGDGDDRKKVLPTLCGAVNSGVAVIGYKIHRAMKLLSLEAALTGEVPMPVDIFKLVDDHYNRHGGFIDPIGLLFGTSEMDLFAVAARCGVTVNPDDPRALVEFAQALLKNVDLGE